MKTAKVFHRERFALCGTTSYISSILACYNSNMIYETIIVARYFAVIPGVAK